MDLNIIILTGFLPNNPLRKLGDVNLQVDSKAYNIVEMTHSALLPSVVDYIIVNVADTHLYINQSQNMHIKRSKLNICIIRIDPNLAC